MHKFKAKKIRRAYEKQYYIASGQDRIKFVNNKHSFFKYINIDVHACFDEIDHEYILKSFPISKNYRFLLKAWLTAPIYGPSSHGDKNLVKWTPTKGVPQGSILGPVICNSVLSGLDQFLTSGIKKKFTPNPERKDLRVLSNISVIRFIDDILILGKGSDEDFSVMHHRLCEFLKMRGLSIKNYDQSPLFESFKPGSSFEYLGFKFIYPNTKTNSFHSGKFTKYNPNNFIGYLRNILSSKGRSGPYLLIRSKSFKKVKYQLKEATSSKFACLEVYQIIDKINSVWRGSLNYFAITLSCRVQLGVLNSYIVKRIMKLLFIKFRSAPKLKSFVFERYYNKGRFCDNGRTLLDLKDFKSNNNRPLISTCKTVRELSLNYYLDFESINHYRLKREVSIIKNVFIKSPSLKRGEVVKILFIKQLGLCQICKSPIKLEFGSNGNLVDVELEHDPSILNIIIST